MEAVVQSKFSKSSPKPTRFEEPEDVFLERTTKETGIPVSELIRRGVRLLRKQSNEGKNVQFLVSLNA